MGLIETEGVILKSYSLAEADKIVIFLTQEQGLIRGVAKGAKRLKSKFGGSLEPFTIVKLEYNQKEERELVSIRQIELLKSYFEKAAEPIFLQKFSYLADLLIEFSPPNDPNQRLYRMTKVCLQASDNSLQILDIITLYFELWLLRLGGYLPDWEVCNVCKRKLELNESASIQINFQLLCNLCRKTRNSLMVSGKERELFNSAQKLSPENFIEYSRAYNAEVKDISTILKRIISHILGKEVIGEKVILAIN
ncbi:MAG TPA: DNA repair protein RecO [Pyrinomonadaceae bacterium]|nr:DNA repair protein RecO [Pyrinomonadaceae bacterium]